MFEVMEAGRGGWSEWIHPLRKYRAKCCDCGLVHDMQFLVVRKGERLPDGRHRFDPVIGKNLTVLFRARRAQESKVPRQSPKKIRKTAAKSAARKAAKAKPVAKAARGR